MEQDARIVGATCPRDAFAFPIWPEPGALGQTLAMTAVIIVVAAFVLYPIYYLLQAAFDVGAPDTVRRPRTVSTTLRRCPGYWEIMLNTLGVIICARRHWRWYSGS